jgi:hypothetical protein
VYDDDRFDDYEDRWEPSEPPQQPPRDRRTAVGIVVAVVVALVTGIAGFAVGSSVGGTTDTVEQTVTNIVTATTTDENLGDTSLPGDDGSGKTVPCSPGPGPRKQYEPNDSADRAAGPFVAGEALKGELRKSQDVDYWAFCVARPTQVTLSLECARGACDDVLADFPADADFANSFGTDKPITCRLPRAGHYRVKVDSDVVPVIYRIAVDSKAPDLVVDQVPPGFPDEPNDVSC